MFRKLSFYILLLFSTVTFSQIGGKAVYQFLNLVSSPRQAALGGKAITIFDYDVNQANFNPAAINPLMDNRLSLNYGNYLGEVTYGTASYAYTVNPKIKTFYAGINYVNYGDIDGYDEIGNATSTFSGSEIALSVGYAYVIPKTKLHVGATGKFISSTLESYKSYGGALDVGLLYVDDVHKFNYALTVRNFGTQFKGYNDTKEDLATDIMLGISQRLENVPLRWHLTIDNLQQWQVAFSNPVRAENSLDGTTTEEKVSFFNNALRHFILGAELFPEKGFNIRLGYNFRRGEELKLVEQRNFSGLAIGMGLKMGRYKFDYSYSRYTLAANTSLFGLTIDFNGQ